MLWTPHHSYSNPHPAADDYAKEPPVMPPHLQLTLLNVPPTADTRACLPRPQHVILNHIYLQRGQVRAGCMGGCTPWGVYVLLGGQHQAALGSQHQHHPHGELSSSARREPAAACARTMGCNPVCGCATAAYSLCMQCVAVYAMARVCMLFCNMWFAVVAAVEHQGAGCGDHTPVQVQVCHLCSVQTSPQLQQVKAGAQPAIPSGQPLSVCGSRWVHKHWVCKLRIAAVVGGWYG